MKICGLEKLSLVDYPGNASAVVFTGGCNFLCPFCHNSGLVYSQVPQLSTDEVMEYLMNRKKLLDGVVISGGEPTLQPDLVEFIKSVKSLGYKVKLDTNGTNPKVLKELFSQNLLDFVAMDIKNGPSYYSEITGVKNVSIEKLKESIDLIKTSGVDYEFRTTLVAEFHTKESIMELAKFVGDAKKLVFQRFESRESCIQTEGLSAVPKAVAEEYIQQVSSNVKNITLRGY